MVTFKNRVAWVTGGGRGIGRALALALAREGVSVAVSSRTDKEINAVAEEIRAVGSRVLAVQSNRCQHALFVSLLSPQAQRSPDSSGLQRKDARPDTFRCHFLLRTAAQAPLPRGPRNLGEAVRRACVAGYGVCDPSESPESPRGVPPLNLPLDPKTNKNTQLFKTRG